MSGLQLSGRLAVHAVGPTAMPLEFSWRGRRHVVRQVERVGSAARPGRYQLVTTDGLCCVVTLDRERCTWQLERMLPRRRGGLGG
jgi:hypothetical protein